jgi:hypothetical protein
MKSLSRILIICLGLLGVVRADIDASVVAKIVVKEDSSVLFDGRKVEVRELDALLTPIKEKKGVVWYYRANPQFEPSPIALEVLKSIMAKRVPIKLFSKEDFSESVGPDGKPRRETRG